MLGSSYQLEHQYLTQQNGVVGLLQNVHQRQCMTQGHLPKEDFLVKAFRQQL